MATKSNDNQELKAPLGRRSNDKELIPVGSTGVVAPRRIQLKRTRGWKKPENTVVVSRPSTWGNPYKVDDNQSAAEAVEKYREYLSRRPEWIAAAQSELKGKNLACWCKPGTPCHAEVLLAVANSTGATVEVSRRANHPVYGWLSGATEKS